MSERDEFWHHKCKIDAISPATPGPLGAWLGCCPQSGGGGMVRDVDIARWRLRSQHLVSPHAASARDVIGSLLAVQAENAGQAAWAVAARTRDPDRADLARLLDDGSVVRTHVLR